MKPTPALEPKWLRSREVAEALGLALSTVTNDWRDMPDLARAARKRGRALRFEAAAIAEIQQKAKVIR